MFHKLRMSFFISALFFFLMPVAAAEELDEGDIQPWRVGAEIFVNKMLFETDFGDLSGGLFTTSEPGFDVNVAQGTFTPGNWLRFQAVGQLLFWNGTQWSKVIPNGERIEITDALDRIISFTVGTTDQTIAVIGEIGSNGGLHEHLSFRIFDASNTQNGTPGAYRIQLKLFESRANDDTSVSVALAPVAIVFNRGLKDDSFKLAVTAAADLTENSVFIAETGVVTIQRVKALGAYYQVKMQYIGDNKFQLMEANELIPAE